MLTMYESYSHLAVISAYFTSAVDYLMNK